MLITLPQRKRWKPRTKDLPVLTKAQTSLWEYYRRLGSQYRRSLARIATETGLSLTTIQRGNARLKELGWLTWVTGHANRLAGARGVVNEYTIIDAAIRGGKEKNEEETANVMTT